MNAILFGMLKQTKKHEKKKKWQEILPEKNVLIMLDKKHLES